MIFSNIDVGVYMLILEFSEVASCSGNIFFLAICFPLPICIVVHRYSYNLKIYGFSLLYNLSGKHVSFGFILFIFNRSNPYLKRCLTRHHLPRDTTAFYC